MRAWYVLVLRKRRNCAISRASCGILATLILLWRWISFCGQKDQAEKISRELKKDHIEKKDQVEKRSTLTHFQRITLYKRFDISKNKKPTSPLNNSKSLIKKNFHSILMLIYNIFNMMSVFNFTMQILMRFTKFMR